MDGQTDMDPADRQTLKLTDCTTIMPIMLAATFGYAWQAYQEPKT